jgi:plasmid stabilization system protein ParE
MSHFEISYLADQDLENIAKYTIESWDIEQAEKYLASLDQHFEKIHDEKIMIKNVFKHRNDLKVSRCKHHVIFHLNRQNEVPLILAVFHERMDLMVRLKERI